MMLLVSLLCSGAGYAQLAQINPAELPQDERVKAAYSKVLPVESLTRNCSPNWTSDTTKEQVVSVITSSLQDLRSAETHSPENTELLLLTGLSLSEQRQFILPAWNLTRNFQSSVQSSDLSFCSCQTRLRLALIFEVAAD